MRPKKRRRAMTEEELESELADLGVEAVRVLGEMLREEAQTYAPEVRLKAVGLALEYSVAKPAKKMGVSDRGDAFAAFLGSLTERHDADPGSA